MQPRTHAFFLDAAVDLCASTWTARDLPALREGDRDEDDFVVLGVRLRAPGLTHTYRPGRRRGELLAPSAKTRLVRCVARARRQTDPRRAAWWLGRACHLLGDMAVPARTRGVWHFAGDPLERFCEEAAARSELRDLVPRDLAPAPERDAAALADGLAAASAAFAADTTRTPWGRFAFARRGRGVRLDDADVGAQARALVPLAVAHVAALLASVARP